MAKKTMPKPIKTLLGLVLMLATVLGIVVLAVPLSSQLYVRQVRARFLEHPQVVNVKIKPGSNSYQAWSFVDLELRDGTTMQFGLSDKYNTEAVYLLEMNDLEFIRSVVSPNNTHSGQGVDVQQGGPLEEVFPIEIYSYEDAITKHDEILKIVSEWPNQKSDEYMVTFTETIYYNDRPTFQPGGTYHYWANPIDEGEK